MHPVEVEKALQSLTVIVDTREQDTAKLRERLKAFPQYEREKLNAGDYSSKVLINGNWYYLPVAVERKMDIDELCYCFCWQRDRFEREFLRAKSDSTKLYLLIESATWEKIYKGTYASKMSAKSLVGSIISWLAKFNCSLMFCTPATSGKLIYDILYYETRAKLLEMTGDDMDSG